MPSLQARCVWDSCSSPRVRHSAWCCSLPRRPWGVNPLQEVNAAVARIDAGVSTYRDEIEATGGDWQEFLRQARLARRYGAAVVVMCFDEKGQADTLERKAGIARSNAASTNCSGLNSRFTDSKRSTLVSRTPISWLR